MRHLVYILSLSVLFLSSSCDTAKTHDLDEDWETEHPDRQKESGSGQGIPEGYFEVVFSPSSSRAAVSGADNRISSLHYILFDAAGNFVKERNVLSPGGSTPSWPVAAVRDTLPLGSYRAVFVGNAEKTLFPYATETVPVNYKEVLTGYQDGYTLGRIHLPPAEFTNTTEYYLADIPFSNSEPAPYIILQRIIGMHNLHRNFVDAQQALDALVLNIVTQIGYKNIIRNQVNSILPGLLEDALDLGFVGNLAYSLVGGLDALVNALVGALVEPVTEALYEQLLASLVSQIGIALTGNADQSGLLAFLGVLLNPWATSQADAAIVTINNFPKSVDFNLDVQDVYTGLNRFKFKFTDGTVYDEKDILVKGFNGLFDVREINVVKQGLLAGVVIDQTLDGSWLLNGTFIDINDPISQNIPANIRYQSDYSFIDLGLKSYATQTNGPKPLTLTIKLGDLPNLDGIVKGIPLLGPILNNIVNLVINPIRVVTVSVPVNLPLLGIDNLQLSGGWSVPAAY